MFGHGLSNSIFGPFFEKKTLSNNKHKRTMTNECWIMRITKQNVEQISSIQWHHVEWRQSFQIFNQTHHWASFNVIRVSPYYFSSIETVQSLRVMDRSDWAEKCERNESNEVESKARTNFTPSISTTIRKWIRPQGWISLNYKDIAFSLVTVTVTSAEYHVN